MNQETVPGDERPDDTDASPVYVEGRCLYVSAREWNRLCHLESTSPLASVLKDGRALLAKDGAMRLLSIKSEVYISADRPSELQRIIDDANARRAALDLAPVILIDQ